MARSSVRIRSSSTTLKEKLTWTSIKIFYEGKWHELKGQARQTFAKLTDDDVERMSGKMEEFSGVLQQKYGYTKAKADKEIDDWLKEADKKLHAKV